MTYEAHYFSSRQRKMRQQAHDEELNTNLQQVVVLPVVTRLTRSIAKCRQQCEEQRVACSRWTYLLTESLSLQLFTMQQVNILVARLTQRILKCRQQCEEQRVYIPAD